MAAAAERIATAPPRIQRQLEPARLACLWLTGASSALVLIEPSPYEVVSLVAIAFFAVTGLSLRAPLLPLIGFLFLVNIGYTISAIPVLGHERTAQWVAVSWYLAVTCVFFAAMLGVNTERRLSVLINGYTAAAVIASVVAVAAYFRLFGGLSEHFLRYGRAQGTFNDPNVLGAFLCTPALLAFRNALTARGLRWWRNVALLGLFCAALFLSFSRGAWGQFALSAAIVTVLTLVTRSSPRERFRIVIRAAIGALALLVFVGALLSIGSVADLFTQRASLDQSYDAGHLGRFGRHILGFELALDHPLGIGPLQFPQYFPEDPHNSYLNAFVSGGWLGGVSYLALIAMTLVTAARFLTTRTPWQPATIVIFAAFAGTAGESVIIDSDHWRHYLLLTGILWGLTTATAAYRRTPGPAAAEPAQTRGRAPETLAPGAVAA